MKLQWQNQSNSGLKITHDHYLNVHQRFWEIVLGFACRKKIVSLCNDLKDGPCHEQTVTIMDLQSSALFLSTIYTKDSLRNLSQEIRE